ncbi:hypothetical protein MBRA1_002862 [Malassezia brasiliensis]|uniref:Domain of unknown function at the cortex 1 domain-containing protein n=1 Tax=Malassezia brasiliensis TaxID=1821822 RepID=A0AAF0DWK1_9BASI|nr:hypothetical protein MBRA1_002862 [Malassezia brasiliensis]
MAPKLRISAGPDVDHLKIVNVNHDNEPFVVDSERFHGRLTVRIKDFVGESGDGKPANKTTAYFQEPYGDSMTYSIQMQGLTPIRYVDPNLNRAEHPYNAQSAEDMFKSDSWPPFPTPNGDSQQHFVNESIAPLFPDVVTVDFCNGFIDFNTLQLVLPFELVELSDEAKEHSGTDRNAEKPSDEQEAEDNQEEGDDDNDKDEEAVASSEKKDEEQNDEDDHSNNVD